MTLNDYVFTTYRDGGRGPKEYDCWGICRSARHELYGRSLLQLWGRVDPMDKGQVTDAWGEAVPELVESSPVPGCIACVFRGETLLHVGCVVDGDRGLSVLETIPRQGPRILPIAKFERIYHTVRYYDDRDLSQ